MALDAAFRSFLLYIRASVWLRSGHVALMKKYLTLVLVWTVLVTVALGFRSAGQLRADPTDDFSFTLGQLPQSVAYRIMPEKQVTHIFEDRLDKFPKSEAPKLAQHLLELCKRHRFDPAFILAMIEVESRFQIKVVSYAGAVGLMQIMPATAVVVASKLNPELASQTGLTRLRLRRGEKNLQQAAKRVLTNPYANLSLGVAYLAWLRDKYEGLTSYYLVAAYNVGPARMDVLRARKHFKPVATKLYFEAIRRGVPNFRYYRREA